MFQSEPVSGGLWAAMLPVPVPDKIRLQESLPGDSNNISLHLIVFCTSIHEQGRASNAYYQIRADSPMFLFNHSSQSSPLLTSSIQLYLVWSPLCISRALSGRGKSNLQYQLQAVTCTNSENAVHASTLNHSLWPIETRHEMRCRAIIVLPQNALSLCPCLMHM